MKNLAWLAAALIPIFYLVCYTPYGMDTTDFGYFYAYPWRILQGQVPYRDFFYIKPAFPLYWHAFWLWLTPQNWEILAGKAGFCLTLLASAWLGALYLLRSFKRAQISLPLLATTGFVFGIHSFPHMPWHTADGVLFCAGSLYAAVCAWPVLAGILAALATACKQSFALVPFAIGMLLWVTGLPGQLRRFLLGFAAPLALAALWLWQAGAWQDFRTMTTGQLDIREALDAAIWIYLRQNWWLPLCALAPLAVARFFKLPITPQPAYCYLICLALWYIWQVYSQKTWIGFGASWPTLFMLLGCAAVLWPGKFLLPLLAKPETKLATSLVLAAALLAAWSVAISGGYKIPAFFAAPLIFSFWIFHSHFFKNGYWLQWATLATGLLIFWCGYQYPYVFPQRQLARAELSLDAGEIYPQASHVYVDRDMYERLAELKALRAKYGPSYKTLPGFSFAYYLNGDRPVIGSDWLIDWEINGEIERLYNELVDKDVTVFMEKDQLNVEKADAYARAGYGVPQRVRKLWKIVEETPHFVVFQKP